MNLTDIWHFLFSYQPGNSEYPLFLLLCQTCFHQMLRVQVFTAVFHVETETGVETKANKGHAMTCCKQLWNDDCVGGGGTLNVTSVSWTNKWVNNLDFLCLLKKCLQYYPYSPLLYRDKPFEIDGCFNYLKRMPLPFTVFRKKIVLWKCRIK